MWIWEIKCAQKREKIILKDGWLFIINTCIHAYLNFTRGLCLNTQYINIH